MPPDIDMRDADFPWESREEYLAAVLSDTDVRVWARYECMIRPEESSGDLVPLVFTPPQEDAHAALTLARQHTNKVRIVHLKARQIYGSTFWAAVFSQCVARDRLSNGLVLAYELKTTKSLMRMYRRIFQHLNQCAPMLRLVSKGIETHEFQTGAMIESASAKNAGGGHGLTHSWVHASEVARWADAEETLEAIGPASQNAHTIVMESTAAGRGGLFHDTWKEGLDADEWVKSRGAKRGYLRVFTPWHRHPGYRLAVGDEPLFYSDIEQELVAKYHLDAEQIAWMRATLRDVCRNRMTRFQESYPSCPEEAFTSTGAGAITPEALSALIRGIEEPIEKDGDTWIWEYPIPGARYVLAVDPTGGGPHGDFGVVHVLRLRPGAEPITAAEHVERCRPAVLAAIAIRLAYRYGQGLVGVERTGLGLACTDEMRRLAYFNVVCDAHGAAGIPMTASLRRTVCEIGRDVAESGTGVRSSRLLDDLCDLRDDGIKIEHATGCHDDAFRAWALAHWIARKHVQRAHVAQDARRRRECRTRMSPIDMGL